MSVERSDYVMRSFLLEVAGKGKLHLLEEIAHEDMVDMGDGWPKGRAGLCAVVEAFRSWIAEPEVKIQRLVAAEDGVMAWWRVRGTHSGTVLDVPATGRRISGQGCVYFAIRDGKIDEYRSFVDGYMILDSIGMLKKNVPDASAAQEPS